MFRLSRSIIVRWVLDTQKKKEYKAREVSLDNATNYNNIIIIIIIKVTCSRYRPGVAQRVGRGIALLFHDRGTRRG